MPTLAIEDLQDIVSLTLNDLGRARWTDLATDLQRFEVMPRLLQKSRVQFASSKGIARNIMKTNSGAAKHTGLFNNDVVNVEDVMATMEVPVRHTTTNYAFDRREPELQGDESEIVDIVKIRRADAMIALAELMEEAFFGKPSGSSDKVTPWGLDYWLVSNASQGFNGGVASGFSDVAGVDPTSITRFNNWTDTYTAVTKADLIKKMRKASRKTHFMSPIDIPDYRQGRGQRFRIYVNETTLSNLEDLGEAQNENLGRDLASMDGAITFRRNPLVWVPYLDDNASVTNPVQMIDWGSFFIFFIRGEHLRESVNKAAGQHNVVQTHVDSSWNMFTPDKRRHALLYDAS